MREKCDFLLLLRLTVLQQQLSGGEDRGRGGVGKVWPGGVCMYAPSSPLA